MNQAERKYPTRSDKRRRGNSTRLLKARDGGGEEKSWEMSQIVSGWF